MIAGDGTDATHLKGSLVMNDDESGNLRKKDGSINPTSVYYHLSNLSLEPEH